MKKLLFLLTAFMAISFFTFAQSAGDYMSVAGSELQWEDISTWTVWNGSSYEPATDYPANGGAPIDYAITIPAGSEVISGMIISLALNVTGTGQLLVESGGVLTMFSGDLTIAAGATVTIVGDLNCVNNINTEGDLTVTGTLRNFLP